MARRRRIPGPVEEAVHELVGPYTGDDHTGGRRVYSRTEVREQMHLVEQMAAQGMTARQMHAAIARSSTPTALDGLRLSRLQVLLKRVEARWAEEDEAERPKWKTKQIRRLHEQLRVAMNGRKEGGAWVIKPNPQAAVRLEELLAKIQGNLAPTEVRVDVHVAHAVQHVIADLSAEEVAEAIARHDDAQRLADEYRAMLAAGKVLTSPMGQEVLPASDRKTG